MDLDPDKLEQFFDATEEWNSSINMSNRYVGMYTINNE